MQATILILLCIAIIPAQVFTYNILLMSPFSSKSHKNSIDPAISELLARGHNVTEVAMHVHKNSTGIRQYELKYFMTLISNSKSEDTHNPFAPPEKKQSTLPRLFGLMKDAARCVLEDKTMHRFIEETKHDHFDVIIVSAIFNDVALIIADKYNAPIILWMPAGLPPNLSWSFNVPSPTSYVKTAFLYFKPPLSFIDRLYNTISFAAIVIGKQYFLAPAIEEIYRNYTKEPFTPILDIERNVSLILVNSHISMEEARPTMPNVIYVGAMHCTTPKQLPKELEDIASKSGSDGFIVFSLGSIVKGTQMPQTLVDTFLRVFGKLKQTVIWKFEGKAENVPQNVIFKDWLPQQDLMGHPNCRLAILHGGLNGLQEAVYHGVPVIGLPLGADRDGNLATSVESGMAEILDWRTVTDETLFQKLDLVLNNPKYRDTAKKLSAILKDRPETPAETAAYWIEYVIRHKGAPHLKANANHLNFFQYFLLDVFAFFLTCIVLFLAAIWFVVKFIFRLFCRNNNAKNKKVKRN